MAIVAFAVFDDVYSWFLKNTGSDVSLMSINAGRGVWRVFKINFLYVSKLKILGRG
jgi:hypothetical protein